MKNRRFATAVVIAALLVGSPSWAQDASTAAQAADLFDQAREDMEAHRYDDACRKFEESLRLDRQVGTQLNLAVCYEEVNRVASAWAIYTEVAETAKVKEDREYAEKAATRLKPLVARIDITVSNPIEGLEVRLDGIVVAPGMPRAVDEGPHQVAATAPTRIAWTHDVTAERGKTIRVEVPALAGENVEDDPVLEPEQPVVAERPRSRGRRPARAWVGAVVGVGGGLALGAATWAFFDARSMGNEAKGLGCADDLSGCPDVAAPIAASAYRRANLATGLAVGGLVSVVAGAVLWMTAPPRAAASHHVAIIPSSQGVDISISVNW